MAAARVCGTCGREEGRGLLRWRGKGAPPPPSQQRRRLPAGCSGGGEGQGRPERPEMTAEGAARPSRPSGRRGWGGDELPT